MVKKYTDKESKLLTETELEIMNKVWDLGECTVREVQEALSAQRDLAYTSVATMMKILEQKKVLKGKKGDKAHTYLPLISRSHYEDIGIQHLTTKVFRGNPASMVMRLLGNSKINQDDLEAIRALLDEKAKT